MPKIIVQKDIELVKTFNLPGKKQITIGSSSGCDIPLEDPSVASEQAKIILQNDGFHLQLVTHIPPVFVTEERVEGDVKLEDGDTITIEDFNLILNVLPDEIKVVKPPEPPPPKPEPPAKEIVTEPEPVEEKAPEPMAKQEKPPIPVEPPSPPAEEKIEPEKPEPIAKEKAPEVIPVLEKPPEVKPEAPVVVPDHEKAPEIVKESEKDEVNNIKIEENRIEPKDIEPVSVPEPIPPPPPPPPRPEPEHIPEPEPPPPRKPVPPADKEIPKPEMAKEKPPEPVEKKPAPKPERKTKVLEQMDFAPPAGKVSTAIYLLALSGPLKGQKFKLKEDKNKIGRDRNKNDIVIREDSKGQLDKSVSRQHAIVEYVDGSYYLSDKISQMRTKLNNRSILTSENAKLKSGDIIEICSMKESSIFRFVQDGNFDFSPPGKSSGLNMGDKNLMPYFIIAAAVIVVIVILILLFK